MNEAIAPPAGGAADEVQKFGYTQKLKRSVTSYESFALAFSIISITTGIFTTYGFALAVAGPRGIWMWIVAGTGQMLVVLILAQLATHIPLSGSSYQWASRLANPKVGWGFGWLSYAFFAIATVSVAYALSTQALAPLFGWELSTTQATELTIGVVALWALLSIFSTQAVAGLNAAAVVTEVLGVVGISIALLVVVAVSGDGSVSNLTSRGEIPGAGYYALNGPFMLAVLLGAFTLTGFEAAANMAEETKQPERAVPWAIVRAAAASVLLGLFFLLALTVAIPDVPEIAGSAAPVAQIMHDQLGNTVEKLFLVVVSISIFATGTVCMVSGSRIVYAMSRDRRFPLHRLFAIVPARLRTPMPATVLIFAGAALIMAFVGSDPETLSNLFTATAILPAIIYMSTMILFLATRKRLPGRSRYFDLGRFAVPIAVGAIVWLAFELTALLFPSIFWTSVKIVGVFIGVGAVVMIGNLLFARDALEHEPGAVALDSEVPAEH